MAIKLNASESYTVYAALDDALAERRRGIGSKHTFSLSEEEHLKLQGRYLKAWLTLEQIEGKPHD
jgi:hypothetical protein